MSYLIPLLLAIALSTGMANANTQQQATDPDRALNFYWENDTFFHVDQAYTDGQRIEYSRKRTSCNIHYLLLGRLVPKYFKEGMHLCAAGWAVGQTMYTPQNISIRTIIPNDRPYGGWLYFAPTFSASCLDENCPNKIQHDFQLLVGVVGPWSGAKQVQTWIHEHVAHAPKPLGWANQISGEPTFNLMYTLRRHESHIDLCRRRVVDLSTEANIAVGNVFTYGGAGGTLRIGVNMADNFGPFRIEPTRRGVLLPHHSWELYGFVRLDGRYVLHNSFLDGGWFTDSPQTATKRRWVGDREIGAAVRVGCMRYTFRWVKRSAEFNERPFQHSYGAMNLSIVY